MDTRQTELMGRALALLDRAVIDHDKARIGGANLYRQSERWDFVRGARELLKLAKADSESPAPAVKTIADALA
jgi:hypothetical protein